MFKSTGPKTGANLTVVDAVLITLSYLLYLACMQDIVLFVVTSVQQIFACSVLLQTVQRVFFVT